MKLLETQSNRPIFIQAHKAIRHWLAENQLKDGHNRYTYADAIDFQWRPTVSKKHPNIKQAVSELVTTLSKVLKPIVDEPKSKSWKHIANKYDDDISWDNDGEEYTITEYQYAWKEEGSGGYGGCDVQLEISEEEDHDSLVYIRLQVPKK
jgi:hypothetical protein